MPDELYAIADSTIAIGGALATKAANFVAGDFTGQSWVNIDGWTTCGSFGDSAEVIATSLINRGRVLKQKGTNNAGTMENTFAVIDGDAGQAALKTAMASNDSYAFRVTASTGEIFYFIALVMTTPRAGGDANSVWQMNVTLEINSNIVEA